MDADESRPVRRQPGAGGAKRVRVRRPRRLARPSLPEGSQRDVRDLLHDLHEQAGRPTLEDLEKRIAGDDRLDGSPKKDLIHRIISRGGPAGLDDVRAVARTLARACGQDEFAVAAQVAQVKDPSAQLPPLQSAERSRVGRPIDAWDPLALEVHPAIQVPGERSDALPAYMPRAHDAQLREVVDLLLAEGSSRLVTLVGGSSTGKTRACWELARYLDGRDPGRWWLWHPYDPTRPDAALTDLGRAGPYTIVWLNEAQFYLAPPDPSLAERIAAGLRTLLHDAARGPVLVLATLWPEYWNQLTVRPDPGKRDSYAQARDLLTGTSVSVPERFAPYELAGLQQNTGVDSRLRQAAAHAEGGRITQYLAGAPELEARYRTAPPPALAIIQVAMDAVLLGHPRALPHALLERAAPGYLDDHDWDAVGENWLESALAYTAQPCRGVRGPLTRIHGRSGDRPTNDGHPLYRLADYVEQIGRRERAGVYPPDSLWQAFAATVTDPLLLRKLGWRAQRRYRYQHAIWLYRQAADRGDIHASGVLARMREQAGDSAGADIFHLQAAHPGDSVALRVRSREQAGDTAGAEALAIAAANRGNLFGLGVLARLREQAGDTAGAEALAIAAANRGDLFALRQVVRLREQAGDTAGAEHLAADAAYRGDPGALHLLAHLRVQAGDTAGAEALAVQAADRGDTTALWKLARVREQAGDFSGAEALYRQAADRSGTDVQQELARMRDLARLREAAGDRAWADALAVQAADWGDDDALEKIARIREQAGDAGATHRIQRFGLTGSGEIATGLDFDT